SAIVNTVRQFAMAFGIIILTSIISITVALMDAPQAEATYTGTSYALAVMAVLALAGFLLTLLLKENRYGYIKNKRATPVTAVVLCHQFLIYSITSSNVFFIASLCVRS